MELSEQARQARNAYQRNYLRKNPDKRKKYLIDYWERQAAKQTPEMRARELKAEGYTQREIATLLNVSLGTVNNYLKER